MHGFVRPINRRNVRGLPGVPGMVTLLSPRRSHVIAPSTLAIGAPAPDFTLSSTSGKDVQLSGFRGRQNVLLAFFPLAFTSTCTAELCAFSDDFDRFPTTGTPVGPPAFPQWLEVPGFWDEAHLYQYAARPLFTVSFLAGGEVLPVRCRKRQWVPGTLTLEHTIGALRARELRAVAGGALGSSWEITNPTHRAITIDIVAWTAVDGDSLAARDVARAGAALAFVRTVADRQQHRARVAHELVLSPGPHSFAACRSEPSTPVLPPQFDLTPSFDRC